MAAGQDVPVVHDATVAQHPVQCLGLAQPWVCLADVNPDIQTLQSRRGLRQAERVRLRERLRGAEERKGSVIRPSVGLCAPMTPKTCGRVNA